MSESDARFSKFRLWLARRIIPSNAVVTVGDAPDTCHEDVAPLSGRPAGVWWTVTVVLFGVVIAAAAFGFIIDDHGDPSDNERNGKLLLLVLGILGVVATVAATIAITRALTRPGAAVGIYAKQSHSFACHLRDAVLNLSAQLHRIESRTNAESRDEATFALKKELANAIGYSLEVVERWLVVVEACSGEPFNAKNHSDDYSERSKKAADLITLVTGENKNGIVGFVVPGLSDSGEWSARDDIMKWLEYGSK